IYSDATIAFVATFDRVTVFAPLRRILAVQHFGQRAGYSFKFFLRVAAKKIPVRKTTALQTALENFDDVLLLREIFKHYSWGFGWSNARTAKGILVSGRLSIDTSTEYRPACSSFSGWKLMMKLRERKVASPGNWTSIGMSMLCIINWPSSSTKLIFRS